MQKIEHEDRIQPERRPPLRLPIRSFVELAVTFLSALLVGTSAEALVFQVNEAGDLGDNAPGDGSCWTGAFVFDPALGFQRACSLRSAIEESNASAGRDEVRFGSPLIYNANGVAEFQPAFGYPAITDPIEFDGTTAPTYDPDLTPRVVILNNGALNGLVVTFGGGQSTIRGMTFLGFNDGILVNGADGVWIDRCAFGIRSLGPVFMAVNGNNVGISVSPTATNTWIGARVQNDAFLGLGNTISGNILGILNLGQNTRIIGNKIGTDPTGTRSEGRITFGAPLVSLGNTGDGIVTQNGMGLEIGRVIETGTAPNLNRVAMGNLVSNNGSDGIEILDTIFVPNQPGMTIVANQIGTDETGLLDFGNGGSGIRLTRTISDLVIGGDAPEEANRIGGNGADGIDVDPILINNVAFEGNQIGIGSDGVSPLPNGLEGIRLDGGDPVRIVGNTVGFSPNNGIVIGAAAGQTVGVTRVADNFVGVTGSGDAIGNALAGIRVDGGDVTLVHNTVGENGAGIELGDASARIGILANFVGTDSLGRDLGNTGAGIVVASDDGGNQIGDVGQGNVVGWNGATGIAVDQAVNESRVVGNFVGVGPSGLPMPNALHGIRVRASGIAGLPLVIGSDTGTPPTDFEERQNRIAYNLLDAISVANGTNMVARGNRITDNGNISIDLNENGLTPNDPNDPDVGANDLQNSPEMSAVDTRIDYRTGELQVEYRVDSLPANTTYPLAIDFYLADATGRQPRTYVGSDVYPAAIARAPRRVSIVPASPLPAGEQRIVALATTAIDQTSEVSAPVVVPEPGAAVGLMAGVLSLIGLVSRDARGRAARRREIGSGMTSFRE